MGDSGESSIEVIFMLMLDVLFEVVAWDNGIGIGEDANGVVNGGATGNELSVVFIKLAMNIVDITAHVTANTPRFCRLSRRVCAVATVLMVVSLMMTLYMREAYSTPSKVYLLR